MVKNKLLPAKNLAIFLTSSSLLQLIHSALFPPDKRGPSCVLHINQCSTLGKKKKEQLEEVVTRRRTLLILSSICIYILSSLPSITASPHHSINTSALSSKKWLRNPQHARLLLLQILQTSSNPTTCPSDPITSAILQKSPKTSNFFHIIDSA